VGVPRVRLHMGVGAPVGNRPLADSLAGARKLAAPVSSMVNMLRCSVELMPRNGSMTTHAPISE
jgi:hypothetical protein